jgi:hypothetical protein
MSGRLMYQRKGDYFFSCVHYHNDIEFDIGRPRLRYHSSSNFICNAPHFLLLGQGGEAQVRLHNAEVREQLLGLLVADGGRDDDVVAGNPVDRCGDPILVTSLQRVDDAEDLGGVAAGGRRVGEDGTDLLIGVNEEDGADGEGDALLVDVGGVLVVNPKFVLAIVSMHEPVLLTCRRPEQPCAPCRQ